MKLSKQKLEQLIMENFPNEMPSGPSLGRPGPSGASLPERKRKIMVLMDRIGQSLDQLQTYENVYNDLTNSFINLKPAPIIKNFNYVRDENGEKVYETLEQTAFRRAKEIIGRRGGRNVVGGLKKTISEVTTVSELLEEVNQYLQLIETIGVDRQLALNAKNVIYKDRPVLFNNAGVYTSKLFNYGDYLAATGLAIESYTKVIPKLSNPGTGLAIKSIAESFTINFKNLWNVITEKLLETEDVLPSRREFMHAIEPEILKHLMKIKKPTSLYDMLYTDGFMEKMIEKFPIINPRSDIRSGGTAKILLRRTLHALGKKHFITMADGSVYYSPRETDQFILNPKMTQQIGEEYFSKPEQIMETKMKLTKQKLEKLIMEEFKSLEQKIFDKRRQRLKEPSLIRAFGDQDQPINRPEYADKLTTLASSGPEGYQQAKIAADSLDEPLDIELDPANIKTMRIQRPGGEGADGAMYNDEDHFLHFDFILDDGASGFTDEPDMQEVYEFAQRKKLDPQETYDSIMRNYRRLMFSMNVNKRNY